MTKNLYLDIHVLQTVPASNINRDDSGAPKTALYGGVTRARVSSQSWKHAMREAFKKDSDGAEWLLSHRTKKGVQLLAAKLAEKDNTLDLDAATKKAIEVFKAAGIKIKKDENTTGALFLLSNGQIDKLADYALQNDAYDKKELKEVFSDKNSLDLALFGRMVADNPELIVDAASQVAHAISTHEIVPEFDYFTALDDEQDSAGAAMIDTLEFNSSTLYRYANVNVKELFHNLGSAELTLKGIELFIKKFVLSMPTGKQNSFANKTIPPYVMVTIRNDTPVNLVSAFEGPVRSNNGYIKKSIEKLENEYDVTQSFVEKPQTTVVLSTKESKIDNQVKDISSLLTNVAECLERMMNDENISA